MMRKVGVTRKGERREKGRGAVTVEKRKEG